MNAPGLASQAMRVPGLASLERLRPGLVVEVLAEADSSNTRLLERARGGDTSARLLVVEHQSAGRGRQGRPWFTEPAGAPGAPPGPGTLCFSLGLVLAPADWSGLSLAVGVALAEALHPRVRIKWPNDLWLTGPDGAPGRKLGGVLIETLPLEARSGREGQGAHEGGRYAVIGVGLNLAAPAPRPGLEGAVAGWREIEPAATAASLFDAVALPLLAAVQDFERDGFAAFADRFAARDALNGLRVRAIGSPVTEGLACGVDEGGGLRLVTSQGPLSIVSGEVSIRPC